MTYPNALTLLRIFLVPAFLIAVIYDRLAVVLGFFLLAAATDLLGRSLHPDGSCACLLTGFGSRSFEPGSSSAQRHWGHVC
jgi:hypothetical protein